MRIRRLIITGLFLSGTFPGIERSVAQEKISVPKEPQAYPTHEFPGKGIRDAMRAAARRFEHATEENPDYAPSFVGVADWYTTLWCFGFVARTESMPLAKKAALRATEIDDQLADAHTVLGAVYMADWEWTLAEREFRRGIELDPQNANSHHWYALFLAAMGRHKEALTESAKAIALEPTVGNQTGRGAVLYFAHEFRRMAKHMETTIAESPDFAIGYDWLGMAYVQLKRFDEAIITYEKADRLSRGMAEIKAGLGHAYGEAGKTAKAREILRELNRFSHQWHIPPVQIAYVHISLGEKDMAFKMLEKAFREKSWELAFLGVEPWFDPLRDDPRFVDLHNRMQFPASALHDIGEE